MERKKTNWLHNTDGRTVGILSASAYHSSRQGFISVNVDPLSFTVSLTIEQMRELAAEINAVIKELEARRNASAA